MKYRVLSDHVLGPGLIARRGDTIDLPDDDAGRAVARFRVRLGWLVPAPPAPAAPAAAAPAGAPAPPSGATPAAPGARRAARRAGAQESTS